MSLSVKGLQWLKDVERLYLQPYDDQTGKRITSWCKGATIGYGHLIAKREWTQYQNGINRQEAEELFLRDLEPFQIVVRQIDRDLKPNEFDACVILAFNIGIEGFRNSTARKMVANPDYKSSVYKNLQAAWKAFNKSQGKISQGLINRRAAEWDMYSKGIYRHW